ncbi:hypothetical protein DL96DRAFT_1107856 [Flagelloscypha sp. PMI_526]|nr:hypothetical protein DL96DRAFT_1107856 [Flagelloscypha sp. PMI_526]
MSSRDLPPILQELSALASIISSSLKAVTEIYTFHNLDAPSPHLPFDRTSPAEHLASSDAQIIHHTQLVLSSAHQLIASLQNPFLTMSDASMSYHLPSCLRLVEAAHMAECLREMDNGLGVDTKLIAAKVGMEHTKVEHILRLLSTHHIGREVSPNRFASNRLFSLMDTHKPFSSLPHVRDATIESTKYADTNGFAAFIGMCTDELFKASAYLTEVYLTCPDVSVRQGKDFRRTPFNFAFGCEGIGFFGWLEGECGTGAASGIGGGLDPGFLTKKRSDVDLAGNQNHLRLTRFGKAMSGTSSWEVPGGLLIGFDWTELDVGSYIVDVGGGIGSSTMLLANAPFTKELGLKYIVQDREVVVDMGVKAWKNEPLYQDRIVRFLVHDFFTPQPLPAPGGKVAVYLLRVVLHDWPDEFAQRILMALRLSASTSPSTRLLLADWILPMACVDDFGLPDSEGSIKVEGATQSVLANNAPWPLLPNLGKASSNAYWMDLTMQTMFNGQERTLREMVTLCAKSGWKVLRVARPNDALFGYVTAIPCEIPIESMQTFQTAEPSLSSGSLSSSASSASSTSSLRSASLSPRCDTPTFGSRTSLPSREELKKAGGWRRKLKPSPLIPTSPRLQSPRHSSSTSSSGSPRRANYPPTPPLRSPESVLLKTPSPTFPGSGNGWMGLGLKSPKSMISLKSLRSSPRPSLPPPPAPTSNDVSYNRTTLASLAKKKSSSDLISLLGTSPLRTKKSTPEFFPSSFASPSSLARKQSSPDFLGGEALAIRQKKSTPELTALRIPNPMRRKKSTPYLPDSKAGATPPLSPAPGYHPHVHHHSHSRSQSGVLASIQVLGSPTSPPTPPPIPSKSSLRSSHTSSGKTHHRYGSTSSVLNPKRSWIDLKMNRSESQSFVPPLTPPPPLPRAKGLGLRDPGFDIVSRNALNIGMGANGFITE